MIGAAFWLSLALVLHTYLVYPLAVRLAARRIRVRQAPAGRLDHVPRLSPGHRELPPVTIVIAAHNAAQHIQRRIKNLLACDYPPDKIAVVIASDGSTDGTVRIVGRFDDPRIRVLDFPRRRGKAETLAEALDQIHGGVVVFTDASTHFEPDAIRELTGPFRDPDIGIAVGHVKIVDDRGEPSEGLYWRLESEVRRCEARLGIVLGASGAIYAMRRSVFRRPPRPVINDDLVFPLLSRLTSGSRCVFVQSAVAYTVVHRGLAGEFRRRCRIGAGAFQSLAVLGPLARPRHWRHALAFLSHKLLRWTCPWLLAVIAVSNGLLLGRPLYDALFALQIVGYVLAAVGLFARGDTLPARVTRLAASFCVMNAALLVGFGRWVVGADSVVWKPTPRPAAGYAFLSQSVPHPKLRRGRALPETRVG